MMKVRFRRWYSALLSTLLTLLGFESCDPVDEYGAPTEEYGTPYATYELLGTVTDDAGNPVQGIKTSVEQVWGNPPKYILGIDSTETDASGKYDMLIQRFPDLRDHRLVVQDIDGELNGGEFQNDTIDLSEIKATQVEESKGNWNIGKYKVAIDVKLKKKP